MLSDSRVALNHCSNGIDQSHNTRTNDHFPALPRPVGREDAQWLLYNYYAPRYGIELCNETPVTMRLKIQALRQSLSRLQKNEPAHRHITNQICAYERISQLLEMMPCR